MSNLQKSQMDSKNTLLCWSDHYVIILWKTVGLHAKVNAMICKSLLK